ncbi:hypothetical protein [Salinigranum halophilum]|uniref:hypothetical protein n=1 Tax=Salinigranum halophilum TaxID=2565931 RepID=UPI0010A8F461|nr:hypothetical protein [Salinigranum halophilum]
MDSTNIRERFSVELFPTGIITIAVTAGSALLFDTVVSWALTAVLGVFIQPFAFLVTLGVVAIGAHARWGLSLGVLLSGIIAGDWSGGVASGLAVFIAAVVGSQLWVSDHENLVWYRWLTHYGFVALVSTLTLAAATAWLADAFNIALFSIVVSQSFTANLVFALLGAPVAWAVADIGRRWGELRPPRAISMSERLLALGILSLWIIGGYVGSFLYQAAYTVPIELFGRRLGDSVESVVRLGGPQGQYAVFLLGVIALVALFTALRSELDSSN